MWGNSRATLWQALRQLNLAFPSIKLTSESSYHFIAIFEFEDLNIERSYKQYVVCEAAISYHQRARICHHLYIFISAAHDSELRTLTAESLLKKIVDRVSDPMSLQMLYIPGEKISKDFSEHVKAEKRGRSIEVSGLAEPSDSLSVSERRTDLKTKVLKVLVLQVDFEPVEVHSNRQGRCFRATPGQSCPTIAILLTEGTS